MYQISTNYGILKNWYLCNNFIISGSKFSEDIPEKSTSLHEAAVMESEFGGKGALAVIVVLLKSNAKQTDVCALKPERYAIPGVKEAVFRKQVTW